MKNKLKSLLSLLLVLIMLATLVACEGKKIKRSGGGGGKNGENSVSDASGIESNDKWGSDFGENSDNSGYDNSDSEGDSDSDDDSLDSSLTVEPIDFGGDEVNILCQEYNNDFRFFGEIFYSEENPSSVDEAKREVLEYMEYAYNCEVNVHYTTDALADIIITQVASGTDNYDICIGSIKDAMRVVENRCAIDLNSVSTINLSDSWWDQNSVEDLSINGKNYLACGDLNMLDDYRTTCVFFNKDLKEELGIYDDFYALVESGEWTFDNFKEICIGYDITSDYNYDGRIDEHDRFAVATESYNMYTQSVSMGQKIIQKDKNTDELYLTVGKDAFSVNRIINNIAELYKSGSALIADDYFGGYENPWSEVSLRAFIEGRALFYIGTVSSCVTFRLMEDTIGILPMPKADESQDEYYSPVNAFSATCVFIPANVGGEKLKRIGTFVSGFSEISQQKVTYAFREVQLKYRDTRDEESGKMIDIILDSKSYDLGEALDLGGLLSAYMNKTNPAAAIISQRDMAEKTLMEFKENIQ